VQDAYGNTVTTDSSNVTLDIGNNPSGGTLSGTKTVAASGGVASFGGLSIDKVGTGYTLTAMDGSLTSATSSGFNITVPPLAINGVGIAEPANPQAAPKYGKVELVVTLTGGTYTKYYDPWPSPGGLDLKATFTAPDATQRAVFGYYDGAAWRVRFAPTQVGSWTYPGLFMVVDERGTRFV
jgi:hypothetical protein